MVYCVDVVTLTGWQSLISPCCLLDIQVVYLVFPRSPWYPGNPCVIFLAPWYPGGFPFHTLFGTWYSGSFHFHTLFATWCLGGFICKTLWDPLYQVVPMSVYPIPYYTVTTRWFPLLTFLAPWYPMVFLVTICDYIEGFPYYTLLFPR